MSDLKPSLAPLVLTVATQNRHKLQELQAYIKAHRHPEVQLAFPETLIDIPETGTTFFENACLKAQGIRPATGSRLILAEDSGLVIPALSGRYGHTPFPGIHSNRWLTPAIAQSVLGESVRGITNDPISSGMLNEAILVLMAQETERQAQYCCQMVLYEDSQETNARTLRFEAEGTMALWVTETETPQGSQGFGYDPIMHPVVDGIIDSRTVAQLSLTEKNQLSHRGQAFQKVLTFLAEQG